MLASQNIMLRDRDLNSVQRMDLQLPNTTKERSIDQDEVFPASRPDSNSCREEDKNRKAFSQMESLLKKCQNDSAERQDTQDINDILGPLSGKSEDRKRF